MERRALLEILSDYNYWGNFKKKFFAREVYQKKLEKDLITEVIIIITGIRRAGKSSLILKHLDASSTGRKSLVINLEDPRLPQDLDNNFLMDALEAYMIAIDTHPPELVVIDEAQHAKGWEKFARYLVEIKGIKCVVTGSSAGLLNDEYATAVTGRHLNLEVFPLSFDEFLKFRGIKATSEIEIIKNRFKIKSAFNEYIAYGGFPEVALSGDNRIKVELLRNYFNDILVKDITKRYNIKLQGRLDAIAKDYLSNIATVLSFRNVSKTYNVSLQTVERFSKYLSNAYLFFYIKKFSLSKRRQENSMSKLYTMDNGFYTALGFKSTESLDKLMENLVAIKFISDASFNHYLEVYYWQDYGQREVDFVIKKDTAIKQLVQVTYASSGNDIKKRETENIIRAASELKCDDLLIITWDYEGVIKESGKEIKCIPLWKWLL